MEEQQEWSGEGECFARGNWKSLTFLGQQKIEKTYSYKNTEGRVDKIGNSYLS